MNQSVLITLGAENSEITFENTLIVNRKVEFSFMSFTIPLCLATLLLNMRVLMLLWKKEKTIINQMMVVDCSVNILCSSMGTFTQSPYYRGMGLDVYCYPHMVLSFALIILNRLLPVAIAVFR